ncbi:MAG: Uma2 family endonuclease [Acidimicrobiales bacterium]
MSVQSDRVWTYADYAALPDDGHRYQVIEGELVMSPSANTRHQRIVGRVFMFIVDHLRGHGGGQVFVAPYDVVMADTVVVQPDVLFVADADAHKITDANLQGAPTLAIEVLSDSRLDRVRKRRIYAAHGVPEYWIVDPEADRVEVYRLVEGEYPSPTILEPGAVLTTDLLAGLEIDVAALLA